jgi:hypothetical protein
VAAMIARAASVEMSAWASDCSFSGYRIGADQSGGHGTILNLTAPFVGSLVNRLGETPRTPFFEIRVHPIYRPERGLWWVKMRRTRIEHILSALPPLATEERTFGIGSSVPEAKHDAARGRY